MFGAGYNKQIIGNFPFDIFVNCKKLMFVRYLFSHATAASLTSIPELPGNMFTTNTIL
nr:MAG TPA: hypothetical protein [Caudoviricetes sp.]